ncbi:MAG: hypothetical protein HY608_10130, partial [Planctomycetes bacterium]|nr:hypothetical protein [Planctomycetota bacterium]
YRTGDIAEGGLRWGKCPSCGRTTPRVGPTLRRVSNVQDIHLTKIRGTLLDLNGLADTLSGHSAIEEWQLVIQKRDDDPFEVDEMILYAAPRKGAHPPHAEAQIQSAFEVKFNRIVWESVEKVSQRLGIEERLKEQRILDRRPKG